MKRDFLRLADLSQDEHRALLRRAHELKARRRRKEAVQTLRAHPCSSSRRPPPARASRSRRPSASSAAARSPCRSPRARCAAARRRATRRASSSRYVDAIMFRTHRRRAAARRSPGRHRAGDQRPLRRRPPGAGARGPLHRRGAAGHGAAARPLAFVGDCANNMARSFCEAAGIFGFELRLGAPEGYLPPPSLKTAAEVTRARPRARPCRAPTW